jgi:4'-phosphopantetheinyl transferase
MDVWHPEPTSYELPPDEVHVWRAALGPCTVGDQRPEVGDRRSEVGGQRSEVDSDNPQSAIRNPQSPDDQLLSPDELARAHRFHFDRDRRRYIACRAILRTILARYLNCQPADLAFVYGPQGKPALAATCDGSGLSFNASHSHDLALYAVARGRRVGVDVEHLREIREARDIARRYFTPAEAERLDATHRPAAEFLRLWTRKEAVIKAVGVGLSMPLNCFDLSAVAGDGTAAFDVRDPSARGAVWTLYEVGPGAEYHGAVVVEGQKATLRQFEFA